MFTQNKYYLDIEKIKLPYKYSSLDGEFVTSVCCIEEHLQFTLKNLGGTRVEMVY